MIGSTTPKVEPVGKDNVPKVLRAVNNCFCNALEYHTHDLANGPSKYYDNVS